MRTKKINMQTSKEIGIMQKCQIARNTISRYQREYLEFVEKNLNDDGFIRATEALLPFDDFISSKLHLVNEDSPVRNMGFSVMRMDVKTEIFSLSISIELVGGVHNLEVCSRMFIIACQTLKQLREYVVSSTFSNQVMNFFNAEIDNIFYPNKK